MRSEDLERDINVLFEEGVADLSIDEVRGRASGSGPAVTRSRPTVAIAAFAAVIVGGLVIGVLTEPSDPAATTIPAGETATTSSPSPTTSIPGPTTTPATSSPSGVFVPPTRTEDGMTHVALTMLDGSHIRLAYPDDLDLTSGGVEVQGVGHIGGDHMRVIGVYYGTPESLRERLAGLHGESAVTARYSADGSPAVQYWTFDEISYLVYDFSPWTVYVWDHAGATFTEEAREIWAVSLFGEIYDPGFLVLQTEPPLELATDNAPEPGDVVIEGESGSLGIFADACDQIEGLEEAAYGDGVFEFCDKATNTLFFVFGDAATQRRIHENLVVDPEVGGAAGDLPILDQPTESHVYLSTDTHLTTIDVDSGVVEVSEMPALAPGDPPHRLVWRGDALVFYGETQNGRATMAVDPDDLDSPWVIKEGTFFIPSAAEDRVWTFAPASNSNAFQMQELSADGEAVSDVSLTPESWPLAAVEDGVLFETGDDSMGLWNPDLQGFTRDVTGLYPVTTQGNRIVTCDDCDGLTLIDLESNTQREVSFPVDIVFATASAGTFSPDGRYVAVPGYLTPAPFSSSTESVVLLVDFDAGAASIIPGTHASGFANAKATWSESGWLFIGPIGAGEGSSDLLAYRPGDETAYRVPVDLDEVYYGMAAR